MNCVSYTRSVSWRAGENTTIGQQNERIRTFMKEKGLKLSATYSDRKQSVDVDTGFREMVDDALQHKFDCLVVDSIAHIGNGRGAVKKVLGKTFFPLGIDFCVAEDNFCSFENSRDDVWKYIDSSFRKNISANLVKRLTEEGRAGLLNGVDEKYGYVLTEDKTGFVIDEEAAEVVREIFRLFVDENESCRSIAQILSERQVLTPFSYRHKNNDGREWTHNIVKDILNKKYYTGTFTKTVDGCERVYKAEPIVSADVFDSAQKKFKKGINKQKPKSYQNIFSGKIIDADSAKKLSCHVKSDGSVIFTDSTFYYESKNADSTEFLSLEKLESAVKTALEKELTETLHFKEYIETEQAQDYRLAEKEKYREHAREIFVAMSRTEENRLPLYQRFQEGKLSETEYRDELTRHRGIIAEYDAQLQELLNGCAEAEKKLSIKNEWYRLYSKMEIPQRFTKEFVSKYVKIIYVRNYSDITVEVYHMDSKAEGI